MRFVKVLLLLVIFVFGLLFFVQNSEALVVPLKLKLDLFYGFNWVGQEVPFYFVVLASFGVGILFATGLLFLDRIRMSCALMARNRAVRGLQKEIGKLQKTLETQAQTIETRSTEIKELPPAEADTVKQA